MIIKWNLGHTTHGVLWFSLVYSVAAWGIGLGPMTVDSSLNERLSGSIELLSAEGQDLSYYHARVAPAEEFEALGLDRPSELNQLSFTVTKDPQGKPVITLRSSKVLKDPFLSLVVELSWPKGHIFKEYTLLLDPPELSLAGISAPEVSYSPATVELNEDDFQTSKTSFNRPVLESATGASDARVGLKLGAIDATSGTEFDDLKQRLKTTEDTLDVLRRTNELLLERQQELAKQNQNLMVLLQKNLHQVSGQPENDAAVPVPAPAENESTAMPSSETSAIDPSTGAPMPTESSSETAPAVPATVVNENTPASAAPVTVQEPTPKDTSHWFLWTVLCGVIWIVYRYRFKKHVPIMATFDEEKLTPLVSEDDDLPFDTHYPSMAIKTGRLEAASAPVVHEVDAIALELDNVDIFLSYEKYTEAEKVLKALQAKAPDRNDIRLRFVSLYAGLKDTTAFEATYQACVEALIKEPNPALQERLIRLKEAYKKPALNLKEKLQQEFQETPLPSSRVAPVAPAASPPVEDDRLHFETPALVATVVPVEAPPEDEFTAGHIEFEKVTFAPPEKVEDIMEFDDSNTIPFDKSVKKND